MYEQLIESRKRFYQSKNYTTLPVTKILSGKTVASFLGTKNSVYSYFQNLSI